jgi:hypothetical protein
VTEAKLPIMRSSLEAVMEVPITGSCGELKSKYRNAAHAQRQNCGARMQRGGSFKERVPGSQRPRREQWPLR